MASEAEQILSLQRSGRSGRRSCCSQPSSGTGEAALHEQRNQLATSRVWPRSVSCRGALHTSCASRSCRSCRTRRRNPAPRPEAGGHPEADPRTSRGRTSGRNDLVSSVPERGESRFEPLAVDTVTRCARSQSAPHRRRDPHSRRAAARLGRPGPAHSGDGEPRREQLQAIARRRSERYLRLYVAPLDRGHVKCWWRTPAPALTGARTTFDPFSRRRSTDSLGSRSAVTELARQASLGREQPLPGRHLHLVLRAHNGAGSFQRRVPSNCRSRDVTAASRER